MKGSRRHRYIAFHIVFEEEHRLITLTEFILALRRRMVELYSTECKDFGLWVIEFDGSFGILKCRYTEKERAIHLLCSLQNINMIPIKVLTLSTSGTIHALKQKIQKVTLE